MGLHSSELPDFPWDSLTPFKRRAEAHPNGVIDLSVGSPVDPTPDVVTEALAQAANAPGYPKTEGGTPLRTAIREYYRKVRHVRPPDRDGIMLTLGSKEMVASLPSLLGLSSGDAVVIPSVCYPTYEVGALLAGAAPIRADQARELSPGTAGQVRLVWLNSPSNPTGRVMSVEELRDVVRWARERGVVVASDECYEALAWEEPWASKGVPSILDPAVNAGDTTGLLALGSLSKRSNAAGYRMAWLAGDPKLIGPILAIRRQMGMMMPGPVQAAMLAALGDEQHVQAQRERYQARRSQLWDAFTKAGYAIDDSQAGLYLWVRAADGGKTAMDLTGWLADLGIIVAPGTFYGDDSHVRVSITASDLAVSEAAARIAES
ncbi:MAG: succinyldiaminopimelate transaminase [Bifidobacteriaceae bacterium]|jgi:succinyldiaminopimelate transaminase|nr:succinyldiaminopimelate transaminase [Bifidobacteriaceae bacterium]